MYMPMLKKSCKPVLKESKTDESLFGKNLNSRMKMAKNIEKVGQKMKKKQVRIEKL